MTTEAPRGLERLARLTGTAVIAALALFVLAWLGVAAARIGHPFELEWIEGAVLGQVERIRQGLPLYTAPSLQYVPLSYAPLYFYVGALAAALAGDGFLPLRLVSLAASLGGGWVLFAFARRESGSPRAGCLAAGLFFATFHASGDWLDLARIDALFLLLLLLSAYGSRFWVAPRAHFAAGGLMALAFHTKQTALLAALCLVLHSLRGVRRAGLAYLAGLLTVGLGGSLLLELASDGWYRYYVLGVPGGHRLVARVLVQFWTRDLFGPLALACVLAAFWLGERALARSAPVGFYVALSAALLGTSYLSRANAGSYSNVLLPAYALLALLFALGSQRALELARGLGGRFGPAVACLVHVAGIVQLGALAYNPLRQVPTPSDRAAGRELVERLRALPGEVFLPGHPYLLERAGKRGHAHFIPLSDVLWHDRSGASRELDLQLRAALESRRFAALVLDAPAWFPGSQNCYRDSGPLLADASAFFPVTGARLRPERLYLPRPDPGCVVPTLTAQ